MATKRNEIEAAIEAAFEAHFNHLTPGLPAHAHARQFVDDLKGKVAEILDEESVKKTAKTSSAKE